MIVTLTVVALLFVAFVFLFVRLASRRNRQPDVGDWLENFTLDSYTPMERLLDRRDVEFLASQPGYRPEIAKRLMAERRKIFVDYLRLLVHDFNTLIAIGKLMIVNSAQDRPQFARSLLRQQARFYISVCVVRCQLALYPLEWTVVDVRDLVKALDAMRDQVLQLARGRVAFGEAV